MFINFESLGLHPLYDPLGDLGYTKPEDLPANLKESFDTAKRIRDSYDPNDPFAAVSLFEYENMMIAPMLDTSKQTSMNSMFSACGGLVAVPLYDTSNVKDMGFMFNMEEDMAHATLREIPQFDTHNVESMEYMFGFCENLIIPLLDATNVRNMGYPFGDAGGWFEFGGFKNLKVSLDLNDKYFFDKDSLMNIINNLGQKDPSFDPNPTLTLKREDYNQLTPADIAIATNKGWAITAV